VSGLASLVGVITDKNNKADSVAGKIYSLFTSVSSCHVMSLGVITT
jgi:hypothetical protein